jgi:hypothetical protein
MRPIWSLLLGVLTAMMGLFAAVVLVPGDVADTLAYSRASECRDPALTVSRSCWVEVQATVIGTLVQYHRYRDDWIVQLTDQAATRRIAVSHRDSFHQLHDGEAVVERFWAGRPILIHVPGQQDLPADDRPGANLIMSVASALFLPAGVMFVAAGVRLARRQGWWDRPAQVEWNEALAGWFLHIHGHRLIAAMMLGGMIAFLLWAQLGIDVWPASVIGLVVTCAIVILARIWRRPTQATPRR